MSKNSILRDKTFQKLLIMKQRQLDLSEITMPDKFSFKKQTLTIKRISRPKKTKL